MKRVYSAQNEYEQHYSEIRKCAKEFRNICNSFGFDYDYYSEPYFNSNDMLPSIALFSTEHSKYAPLIFGHNVWREENWYRWDVDLPDKVKVLSSEEFLEFVNVQSNVINLIEQLNNFDYSTLYHVNS